MGELGLEGLFRSDTSEIVTCVNIPTTSTVRDVTALLSAKLGTSFVRLSTFDCVLDGDELFVNFFEPDAVFVFTTVHGINSGGIRRLSEGLAS